MIAITKPTAADVSRINHWLWRRIPGGWCNTNADDIQIAAEVVIRYSRSRFGTNAPAYSALWAYLQHIEVEEDEWQPYSVGGDVLSAVICAATPD